jgi:hypothetical protein
MMTPLVLEIVRQVLRWAGVWLMTIGLPDEVVALTANEDVIVGVAGFISYALADGGWIVAKWRQWRAS